MMEGYTWCWVRCVTGVWRRLVMATSRDLCVERRDGQRAAQGWQLCKQGEHAGENRRVWLIGRNEMIAASMYSPKFVNEALRVLGKQLIDVQLDQQQTFPSWIHENGKKTITISREIYLIQSKSRKEREKKSSGC